MRVILILLLLSGCLSGWSQSVIRGRVVNEATGAPIPGGSVFISNTSKGTVCDGSGNFELGNIPAGKHDLVISSVGFETNVFAFTSDQLPLQLKIELKIKVKELANVIAEPSVEEGWDKWGKMFTQYFIGLSANASKCRIKNTGALKFKYFRKTNRLIAYADEPLLLENKALGYLVKYQLEEFEVNFSQQSVFFMGYSLFEPMEDVKKKWAGNRREAYNGSIMHFMRSLYNNQLAEEGYSVVRMYRTPNLEKERVKKLYKDSNPVVKNANGTFTMKNFSEWISLMPVDTARYYGNLLHERDYTDSYGTAELNADSLIAGTYDTFKGLSFDNYILVTYKNEKEEIDYVRSQMSNLKPGYQRSFVTLLNDKLVSVDKNGNYYNPQDFFTSGYWSWSDKMANSLPLDYEPNED